jgi:hypothetical protein
MERGLARSRRRRRSSCPFCAGSRDQTKSPILRTCRLLFWTNPPSHGHLFLHFAGLFPVSCVFREAPVLALLPVFPARICELEGMPVR